MQMKDVCNNDWEDSSSSDNDSESDNAEEDADNTSEQTLPNTSMSWTDYVKEALITDEYFSEDEESESDTDKRFEDAIHNAKSGIK